jgi:hypothetical protein
MGEGDGEKGGIQPAPGTYAFYAFAPRVSGILYDWPEFLPLTHVHTPGYLVAKPIDISHESPPPPPPPSAHHAKEHIHITSRHEAKKRPVQWKTMPWYWWSGGITPFFDSRVSTTPRCMVMYTADRIRTEGKATINIVSTQTLRVFLTPVQSGIQSGRSQTPLDDRSTIS